MHEEASLSAPAFFLPVPFLTSICPCSSKPGPQECIGARVMRALARLEQKTSHPRALNYGQPKAWEARVFRLPPASCWLFAPSGCLTKERWMWSGSEKIFSFTCSKTLLAALCTCAYPTMDGAFHLSSESRCARTKIAVRGWSALIVRLNAPAELAP